jgi:hypothetical protein
MNTCPWKCGSPDPDCRCWQPKSVSPARYDSKGRRVLQTESTPVIRDHA